ncbi:orotidine-5'-phosphate decarboxylase [Fructobacillus sp. M2-14]|uniref:Orotidine 5'-phosphate decarboxylase n=1 Tax=Fructobacillus broussonetiae TaxID=2713173 RepID=A0ABS5R0H5_9LACO|nr:orotidine-5'-phosphate decarboxylase [Fructobacillus broussonetiae]MBS9338131.1 orotidine-5'-phosphate decarboxylase [Fructobacillus broussonetiae]
MAKPLMIALDFPTGKRALDFLSAFDQPEKLTVKIGMELFYAEGPSIIERVKALGCDIFLDLKLFDIPNTVKQAMHRLALLGVNYVTVHGLGGSEMIAAAKAGLKEGAEEAGLKEPVLLAVTELTSISDQVLKEEQNVQLPMKDMVLSLAQTARKAGADGVVCSSQELQTLNESMADGFFYLVPGIRLPEDGVQDQKRVASPAFARKNGASAIVVGRPITKNAYVKEAYNRYEEDWLDA